MNDPGCSTKDASLQDEAQAWLARLASGSATADDLGALNAWRARSLAHRRAFAEAALLAEFARGCHGGRPLKRGGPLERAR